MAVDLGPLMRVTDCKFCGVQDWAAEIVSVPSKCLPPAPVVKDYTPCWDGEQSGYRACTAAYPYASPSRSDDYQEAFAACLAAVDLAAAACVNAVDAAFDAEMMARGAAYEACLKNDPPTQHAVIKAWIADDVYVILTSKPAQSISDIIFDKVNCVFRIYGVPHGGTTEQLLETLDPIN